jgi:hypothetical protein
VELEAVWSMVIKYTERRDSKATESLLRFVQLVEYYSAVWDITYGTATTTSVSELGTPE